MPHIRELRHLGIVAVNREKISSVAASVIDAARASLSISSSLFVIRIRRISSPASTSSLTPVRDVMTSAA